MLAFDMQLEIIKRLPVKSLIQCRCVCKAWKSLIDSSQFIAGYKTQSQHLMIRYTVLGHGEEEDEVKYVSYVDDDDDDDDDIFPQQNFALAVPPLVQRTTTIIGSSNGLLCLIGSAPDPNDSDSDSISKTQIAVLWNPTIRKSVAVDVPNAVHQPFDSVVGFGVCPDTNDPKLVKITYIDDHRKIKSISCIPCQVMVFTLSSRQWTCLLSSNLPRKSIVFTWSQAVIGRFIYWLAYDRINVNGVSRNLIMSFDMRSEEFREIALPDSLAESDLSLSRIRESLVLLDDGFKTTTDNQVCDVWMMDHGDDSKAFTKLFTFNAPNGSVSWTLGFRKNGEPIVQIDDDDDDDDGDDDVDDDDDDDDDFVTPYKLGVYELCSKHVKDLGICGNKFFVYSYTESLLLVDHEDGHIVRCGDVKR